MPVRTTIVLALLLSGAGCAHRAALAANPLEHNRATYDGAVTIRPELGTVDARWSLRIARSRDTDSITLLLNDRLEISELEGRDVVSYRDTVSGGLRRITIRLTTRDGTSSDVLLSIAYAGVPRFPQDSINNISPAWVELGLDSFWLPIVDDFRHMITGVVRLTIPSGWQVATAGSVTGDGTIVLKASLPLIDIAFTASQGFRVATAGKHRVFNVRSNTDVVQRVAETANECADYLDHRYGRPSPLPPLRIVLAPRNGRGYARSNYIVITPTTDMSPTSLTRFICHEVAHFWSTGAVSSGPDNWINEAFAEFVSARAVRDIRGKPAYDSVSTDWQKNSDGLPPIWNGTTGARPPARVSYRKAPFLLHRLEERVGHELMEALLRRYMTERIRTTPSVVALVSEITGASNGDWFLAELKK